MVCTVSARVCCLILMVKTLSFLLEDGRTNLKKKIAHTHTNNLEIGRVLILESNFFQKSEYHLEASRQCIRSIFLHWSHKSGGGFCFRIIAYVRGNEDWHMLELFCDNGLVWGCSWTIYFILNSYKQIIVKKCFSLWLDWELYHLEGAGCANWSRGDCQNLFILDKRWLSSSLRD